MIYNVYEMQKCAIFFNVMRIEAEKSEIGNLVI